MVEAFAPPDIEKALAGYLRSRLGVRVSTRVPAERPDRFVEVKRIGGTRANLVQDEPIIMLRAWGASNDAESAGPAADLARATYYQLDAAQRSWLADDCWLYHARIGSPVNNPDAGTDTPRYQMTATLRVAMTTQEITA